MSRITMSMDDATLTELDVWAGRLGQSRSTTAEIAIRWWLAMAAGTSNAEVHTKVHTTAPDPVEKPQVSQNQQSTLPARTPHRGVLPTDTDEILALLEELNAMPDHTEVDPELVILNAVRKVDIQRDVARLRAAVTAKRAQVV